MPPIFTIGHSTRPIEDLLSLVAQGIDVLHILGPAGDQPSLFEDVTGP